MNERTRVTAAVAGLFTSLLTAVATCGTATAAEEFRELVTEYTRVKKSVAGAPAKRKEIADKEVVPLIEKIAALGTGQALAFLVQEYDNSLPEIAGACASAVITGSADTNAIGVVVRSASRQPPAVRSEVFSALARARVELAPLEGVILKAAADAGTAEIKKLLPPVLGKLDTVASAKQLLALLAADARSGARGRAEDGDLRPAIVTALGGTKSAEVRKWLSGAAFSEARSSFARLSVVAEVAGVLQLGEAREDLERLLDHASVDVAADAANALGALGPLPSLEALTRSLSRKRKDGLRFHVCALDAVARAGTPEALASVMRFTTGEDTDLRAVALGSLKLADSPEALRAILAATADDDVNVRSVALAALGGKRDVVVIGALVERLGSEPEHRLRVDILRLLVGLTGKNMGLVAADWAKWWMFEGAEFKFPEDAAAGSTDVRIVGADEIVPQYFGLEITSSKKLTFIVDISSSMTAATSGGARKIDVLKKELVQVVEKLPVDTLLNIIAFHGTYLPWQKELQPLVGPGRDKVLKYVKGLSTGSGTNVFDTLEFALNDKNVDTIYLLTDGLPTRGRIQDTPGILEEVATINRARGVAIHCIAFGEESPLLEALAAQHRGQYKFVKE